MVFVDIHAHLDFKDFDKDRDELVKEMKSKNIIAFTNTLNPKNYFYTKELFKESENVYVCPGLYPTYAQKINESDFEEYLKVIKEDIKSGEVKAIGEVGLDFFHEKDENMWALQIDRFKKIIEFSIKNDVPIIVHARKSEAKVLEILEEYVSKSGFNKVVLHCFSGKKKLIDKIISMKLYCSIPLIVLNTEMFKILVDKMPVKHLLVETDSPLLNPDKIRNSPLNIPRIYKEIANIKGLDANEIENIIYNNYMKLML